MVLCATLVRRKLFITRLGIVLVPELLREIRVGGGSISPTLAAKDFGVTVDSKLAAVGQACE